MNDPAMRRNHSSHNCAPRSAASVSYAPLSAELIRAAAGQGSLTRADQERRARQVASSFRQHIVADIAYHAEQQITVATLRSIGATPQPDESVHQICVEANGNISVLHRGDTRLPADHLIVHRLVLLIAGLTVAVGALGSFILL